MKPGTILHYIEQDDEYMYFKVLTLTDNKFETEYESQGTIYIGRVKGIERKTKNDVVETTA